jgi:hypothetical protein
MKQVISRCAVATVLGHFVRSGKKVHCRMRTLCTIIYIKYIHNSYVYIIYNFIKYYLVNLSILYIL